MKWKFLILFIFVFLVSSSSFLLAGSGEPLVYPPNITILHPINNTIYTIISLDLNFTSNETLNWGGYSLDNNENVSLGGNLSYQETADEIGCEGDWSVTSPCSHVYDGDWNTDGNALFASIAYLYINYSKPSGALNSSLWQIKDSGVPGLINLTIDSGCWSQSPLQFEVKLVDTQYAYWYCWDSSTWKALREVSTNDEAFEEAIWWNMSVGNTTLTSLSDGLHNVTIYGNDSNGNMGQSDYVYFTVSTAVAVPSAKKFVIGAYTTIGGRRIISS